MDEASYRRLNARLLAMEYLVTDLYVHHLSNRPDPAESAETWLNSHRRIVSSANLPRLDHVQSDVASTTFAEAVLNIAEHVAARVRQEAAGRTADRES
ncbi:MAG: hypothetical protein KIT81_18005 [Alphaproteobacteria bacterium]|nr:hypothetical protein [Alphaproteobacteria bacterium]